MASVLKDKVEQKVRVVKLLSIYGSLLSKSQQEILEDYFLIDLSISEISENRGVSRAAIEDALKKGTKKLEYFESHLHNLEQKEKILNELNKIEHKVDTSKIRSLLEKE